MFELCSKITVHLTLCSPQPKMYQQAEKLQHGLIVRITDKLAINGVFLKFAFRIRPQIS